MGKRYRKISEYRRLQFIQGNMFITLKKHTVFQSHIFKYVFSHDVICFDVGFLTVVIRGCIAGNESQKAITEVCNAATPSE